jgi:aryl-alcohol dehydrogenase-like predicted oxidoreductase
VVPIPGTTRVENLEANAAADGVQLTPGDLATLDSLPTPMGTRY